MAKRPVLIELRQPPVTDRREFVASARSSPETVMAEIDPENVNIPGVQIDTSFPAVTLPAPSTGYLKAESLLAMETDRGATSVVRGLMDEDELNQAFAAATQDPNIVSIYADPVIEPCLTCIGSSAVGTAADVARIICARELADAGMDGSGVLLAIVDTGINLDYLRSKGLSPNFDGVRSWVPKLQPGQPPLIPGELPVGHGTMCAYDALIAGSEATLIDIAVLQSRRVGQTAMEGLLSDAVLAYRFLLNLLEAPRRPGDFHSMVVSNSWGMFNRTWDFPVGHPGNYSHNPDHPFNRIVGTLERGGADILFAAGNCGSECPDQRCGGESNAGIFGANSHPQVLSVAGVDLQKNRVGYSTRGPGHLERQKPDISSYTHFRGSGVYPVDGGTSAATPVAAGLVAALRSRFPSGPTASPAMVRKVVTGLAEDRGPIGFDFEYGWGIINGCRLKGLSSLSAGTGPSLPNVRTPQVSGTGTGSLSLEQNPDFVAAIEAFERSQRDVSTAGVDLCVTYRQVKPIIQGLLPLIEAIPVIGKRAADAIRQLMSVLDVLCLLPAPTPASGIGPVSDLSSTDKAFMEALNEFQPARVDVSAAPVDICGIYKKVKPLLKGLLPFLELIPKFGKVIVAAVTALMTALDQHCPAT